MTGVGQRFVDAGYSELKPLIQTGIGTMLESVLRNHSLISSPICIISENHPQKAKLRSEILRIRKASRILEIPGHKKGPSFSVFEIQDELVDNLPSVINYCDFSGIWSEHELGQEILKHDGLILTYTGFHPHMLRSQKFAYVKKDSAGRVTEVQEKMAFTEDPMNEEASSGTYAFRNTADMIEAIRLQIQSDLSFNGEFYTSLTYKPLLSANRDIRTFQIDGFFQWGTPRDLVDFQVWSYSKYPQDYPKESSRRLESATIILAAGGGTRLQSAVNVPKPLLKIFNREMWNYAAQLGARTSERLVLTRSNLAKSFLENNPYNFTIRGLSAVTQNQIETAKFGLKEVVNKDTPLHVLACDNIIPNFNLEQIETHLRRFHMVVWLAESYLGAIDQEEQFSWLEINMDGFATKVHIKSNPLTTKAKLIIGNFSFRNTSIANHLIESLDLRLDQSNKLGNEQHLEFLISEALSAGLKVGGFSLEWFAAIGTRHEYSIAEYFESAFSKLNSPHD